jgi:lipopolysaccharide export system permease protein
MRLSLTLSAYIGRQFAVRFGAVLLALTALAYLLDTIETLRRASTREEVTLGIVLQLSLLKLPQLVQEMIPFVVLFATMLTFWRLSRSHELTVVRAAGISVWQFLLPALAIALLIGAFRLAVLNPVGAVLYASYEQTESKLLRGRTSLLAVAQSGFWLRQTDGRGNSVIYAQRVSSQEMELYGVIVFNFEGTDRFVSRIDAASARLEPGSWVLKDAKISAPERNTHFEATYRLPTDMTLDRIQESFASPETISFWELPSFIRVLENAGFSAVKHRLYWHRLLAGPLLLFAMVLLAATFSLRPPRRGGTLVLVVAGIAAGFLLYFISNLVAALGQNASIPVALAAWTPAGVSTLVAITFLLHLEDG